MEWLSAAEAAARLGVKPATLYAYVSRGVLSRRRSPAGRSVFDAADVELLARRGRPRRPVGVSEVVIESAITALGADRPFYRGRDALELAAWARFEAVAQWLWTGDPAALDARDGDRERAGSAAEADGASGPEPAGARDARPEAAGTLAGGGPGALWVASAEGLAAGRAAQSGLPDGTLPLERLQVVVPALAATDPLKGNLAPDAVVALGHRLIAGMVDSLPGPAVDGDLATRLAARLAGRPLPGALAAAVRAGLVLLADHELASSTLSARVAASVRADPYAAVAAGLAATSGALHGGASLGAEAMIAEAVERSRAGEVLALRLRRGERIPGFGHSVYRSGDGRAAALFEAIRRVAPGHPALAAADALMAAASRGRVPAPNVDLALATLTRVAGMPIGAGEAIFGVSRAAGWLAHAMEEYAHRTDLRLRAVYIGHD
ncbi:MAG TPA: citrate/2-methylcitrate synthase [Asanoa sp.]